MTHRQNLFIYGIEWQRKLTRSQTVARNSRPYCLTAPLGSRDVIRIGVTSLTFQGHVTSSVTWPFDSPYAISYWYSPLEPSLYL